MKITQEVRDMAVQGMAAESERFRSSGGEIYQPVPAKP
jgi:phosphomethylpyrimidine synthase